MSSNSDSSNHASGSCNTFHGADPSLGQRRISKYFKSHGGKSSKWQTNITKFFRKKAQQPVTSVASASGPSRGPATNFRHPICESTPQTPLLRPSLAVSDPELLRPSSSNSDLKYPTSAIERPHTAAERDTGTFTTGSRACRGSIPTNRPVREEKRPSMPSSSRDNRKRLYADRYPPEFRALMDMERRRREALTGHSEDRQGPGGNRRGPSSSDGGSLKEQLMARSRARMRKTEETKALEDSLNHTKRPLKSGSEFDKERFPAVRLEQERAARVGSERRTAVTEGSRGKREREDKQAGKSRAVERPLSTWAAEASRPRPSTAPLASFGGDSLPSY